MGQGCYSDSFGFGKPLAAFRETLGQNAVIMKIDKGLRGREGGLP